MTMQIINVGSAERAGDGESVRNAFIKINENFTEVHALDDRLVNGTKQVVLGANGSLTVPYPTSDSFRIRLDSANFVPRVGKATLTLTGTAWDFYGAFAYSQDGQTQLAADNGPLPSIDNPGYTDGDTFEIDSTAHGIAGYILTVELSNVVQAGPAGWTASLAFSEPPEYPSTITSLGAIKLTSNNNSLIFGTDGTITLPLGGDIVDITGTSVLGGSTDIYKFQYGTIGTKDNPDTGNWGGHPVVLDPGGESWAGMFIPSVSGQDSNGSLNIYNNKAVGNNIALSVNAGSFQFKGTGTLELPHPPNISFNDPSIKFGGATSVATNDYGFGVPGPAAGVVFNATNINVASMKLLVTIEGQEDGGDGLNHTQVCEMLVVRRAGLTVNIVDSVVYGVLHTSIAPLATLTAQLSINGRVEILAQPTNSTPIYVKVHATEVVRGD